MESIINGFLSEIGLNYAVNLPMAVIIALLVLFLLVWVCMYIFNKQSRAVFDKYGIKYELVEPVVNMLTMLAVRLFVMKSSLEDTRKITELKVIASTIDNMYSANTTLRLSDLVAALEMEMVKNHVPVNEGPNVMPLAASVTDSRVDLIYGLSDSITNELSQVGRKVLDNEKDPLVKPREISAWINKSLAKTNRAKKAQKRLK